MSKEAPSTKVLLDEMKVKSEIMKSHLERMFRAHVQRTLVGERISKGLRSKGPRYYKDFKSDKEKLLSIIKEQKQQVSLALADIRSLNNLFELLVASEQMSLYMENQKSKTDASSLIDPEGVPMRKYSYDFDQLKILEDSFEVLRIELERQYSSLAQHDFPSVLDEESIMRDYGYEFSFQGSVNVQNLNSFCDTLNRRLLSHISTSHATINSSDIERITLVKELQGIKLDPSVFFSPTLYDLIKRISRRSIDRQYETIVFNILTFSMSRLKKHNPHEYYRRIRIILLVNDAVPMIGLASSNSDTACCSLLVDAFKSLHDEKKANDETRILSAYISSSTKILLNHMPNADLVWDAHDNNDWTRNAKELCSLAMQVDSAYRTVYSKNKGVSYADIAPYLNIDSEELRKAGMGMVSRYEFLINPKGHFMSQYFLDPYSTYKQKDYKPKRKKKVKARAKAGGKR
jgi:hypothetical protein